MIFGASVSYEMNTTPRRGGIVANQICADCSAPDPSWASLNRGVLICEECCSVHRILGRHVSLIKSLKKSQWPPSQLQMVLSLYSKGANAFWEHALIHPVSSSKLSKRKPSPRDPINPVKNDFIRAKYALQSFIHRPPKDEAASTLDDLSQQLHSTVRTNNIDISLRLLSSGADANYWHPEKGNRPLHIAAKAGQLSQVELLILYGADPGAADINGKSPADHAKAAGFSELADRLMDAQYDLTDRLSYFICQRKPDHARGKHFLVPTLDERHTEIIELGKLAREKLRQLPNAALETLASDVYDEVDRREIDSIFQSSQLMSTSADRFLAAHLPSHPKMSSVHNQERQKLARLNAREFAVLITDVLSEIKRRLGSSQASTPESSKSLASSSSFNDENGVSAASVEDTDKDPVYDVVSADYDEDYLDPRLTEKQRKDSGSIFETASNFDSGTLSRRDASNHRIAHMSPENQSGLIPAVTVSADQFLQMKQALEEALERERNLSHVVVSMKSDLDQLHAQVNMLCRQNGPVKPEPHPRTHQNVSVAKVVPRSAVVQENQQGSELVLPRRDDSGIPEDGASSSDGSPGHEQSALHESSMHAEEESISSITPRITSAIHELKRHAEAGTATRSDMQAIVERISLAVAQLGNLMSEKELLEGELAAEYGVLQGCTTKLFEDCGHNHSDDAVPQVVIDDAFNIVAALRRVVILCNGCSHRSAS